MNAILSKKERKRLISRISQASGIAQYALEAKMTDEQVIEAADKLNVFLLIKSANHFNRHCQAEKTAAANAKLKEFLNVKNSELFKAGQWLLNSLSKTGLERKQSLFEKGLVHKDDYNHDFSELKEVILTIQYASKESKEKAEKIIHILENRNDNLRVQLKEIQDYIINNQGINTWNSIQKYLQK
jgi:hypothetical protein